MSSRTSGWVFNQLLLLSLFGVFPLHPAGREPAVIQLHYTTSNSLIECPLNYVMRIEHHERT